MADRRLARGTHEYLIDGWHLGGAAMRFVLENRALLRFMLGAIAILIVLAGAVTAPTVILRRHAGPLEYVLIGLASSYLLGLMVTGATVGLAGLVAKTLDGQPVTAATGWRVIRDRRRPITGWALVDAVVGIPSKAVGSWSVDQLGTVLLGFGWSLLTFFAIPIIALTGSSARETARQSVRLVRSHWGEAVSSTVYLWVRAVVVFGIPAAVAVAGGVLLLRAGAEFLGVLVFVTGVAGLALTYLLIQGARSVITVVLYRWVTSGTVYPAFPAELLERSVRGPSGWVSRVARRVEGDRLERLRRRVLGELEDSPLAGEAGDPVAEQRRGEK